MILRILCVVLFNLSFLHFSVEFPQGDQPACGRNIKADVMFLYDSGNLGSRKVNLINQFVADFVQNFNMATGNIRTGIMTTNCYRGDISLEKHTDKNTFITQLKKQEMPDLSSVVHRLRLHGFNSEYGGRPNVRKIAIFFLDDFLIKPKQVMSEVRRAKFSNIEIFVMAIGHNDNYNISEVNEIATSKGHVIMFPSYQDLSNEKLQEKCVKIVCLGEFPPLISTVTYVAKTEAPPLPTTVGCMQLPIIHVEKIHNTNTASISINKEHCDIALLIIGIMVIYGVR